MTFRNSVLMFAEKNKEKLEKKYLRVRKFSSLEKVIRKYENECSKSEELGLDFSTTEEGANVKCELCSNTKGRLHKKQD